MAINSSWEQRTEENVSDNQADLAMKLINLCLKIVFNNLASLMYDICAGWVCFYVFFAFSVILLNLVMKSSDIVIKLFVFI